ncbi:MAG TPA: outer membrane beta-barrel protein [Burkholderiales bacterium]|nr:outer membrane beta-barrel protein [Burkholderiales bacterium]
MKKLLIASAVTAAIAAPGAAMAQQARIPTLSQVLDASGISVNGYIDAQYNWANRNLQFNGSPDRVFDSQNNSFGLHQFGLTVAKQPKEGFGGLVNITAGQDAQVIHSFPESVGGPASSMFDLTQAYGSYSKGALTLIAGKFATLAGTEVIASTGNTNISRSILFGAIPFTHTGVRASYAPSDTVTVYAGLNNGWDQVTDGNRQKTLELGATLNPVKPLTFTISGYFGDEAAVPPGTQPAAIQGNRNMIDAVANYIVSSAISLGGEYLYAEQEDTANGTAKWSGLALYGNMMFNPQWRVSVRGEYFDDKQGFHFATPQGTKYYEGTLTLGYLPTSSVELRTEVRYDRANNSVFVDSGGSSKTLMTFGLQGLYKF